MVVVRMSYTCIKQIFIEKYLDEVQNLYCQTFECVYYSVITDIVDKLLFNNIKFDVLTLNCIMPNSPKGTSLTFKFIWIHISFN